MPTASWALLVVAGVAAVADWVAVWRRPSPSEQMLKPLVLVALIGVAVTLDPEHDAQRAWFVVALVCSLAGDVLLLPKPNLLAPGLASFLLAHMAFVVGFLVAGRGDTDLVLATAPLVGMAPVAVRVLRGVARSDRALLGPVVVYISAIAAMAVTACLHGDRVGMAGALLFVVSDSVLAINRFEHERRRGPLAVTVTYHLAQGLLVLSLLP